METAKYITMNGASFLEAHVHSFATEKAFVDHYLNDLKFDTPEQRKAGLKQVYKTAQKTKPKK